MPAMPDEARNADQEPEGDPRTARATQRAVQLAENRATMAARREQRRKPPGVVVSGLSLVSPNGQHWEIQVADDGTLTAVLHDVDAKVEQAVAEARAGVFERMGVADPELTGPTPSDVG